MLTALLATRFCDDVFNEDAATLSLESLVSRLTGHEAALLVPSGTMGNLISLRTLLAQPPYSILCDARSHILCWEAGGVASLTGALVQGIEASNGSYLTLADIQSKIQLAQDVHLCPTRVISLENTLNGAIMPLAETARIATYARAHGVLLHLDGARLWEAAAAGAGRLAEYARLFDTVSLCFSKGLGAPVGSILVGSAERVQRARWIRKSMGGGMRQAALVSVPARIALECNFLGSSLGDTCTAEDAASREGQPPDSPGCVLRATHALAREIAVFWTARGGKLACPAETNMVMLDLQAAGWTEEAFSEAGRAAGIKIASARIVVHYQVSREAIDRLKSLLGQVLAPQEAGGEIKKKGGGIKINP
ncbi:MAG: hypothetical protein M1829_002389 [Trizodia sp. TS-e1964]|nr:MAG: hypothetical protein M1829_002389 [Trizodia sp. TS-e1964]